MSTVERVTIVGADGVPTRVPAGTLTTSDLFATPGDVIHDEAPRKMSGAEAGYLLDLERKMAEAHEFVDRQEAAMLARAAANAEARPGAEADAATTHAALESAYENLIDQLEQFSASVDAVQTARSSWDVAKRKCERVQGATLPAPARLAIRASRDRELNKLLLTVNALRAGTL